MEEEQQQQEALKKKRTFRKYTYRGVDLDQLLDMSNNQLMELLHCRARRRFSRGLKRKQLALIKKLRKAKKEAGPLEKPEVVKTHLRDMVVVPEMVGSIVGVYNGKTFNQVEIKVGIHGAVVKGTVHVEISAVQLLHDIEWQNLCTCLVSIKKPEMIGHYLGEFSITYKPVKHGRPGIGATHSSRFIPLK